MRQPILIGGVAFALLGCGPKAAPRAPGDGDDPEKAATVPSYVSRWDHVFRAGARFDLLVEDDDGNVRTLRATVGDVRGVGDARVARLSWEAGTADALHPVVLQIPGGAGLGQIAEDGRGVAFFATDADDATITSTLTGPDVWMYPEPTEAQDWNVDGPHGENVHVGMGEHGESVACYSMPATGACGEDDLCGGWVCITAEDGLVRVGGQLGPDGAEYRRELAE